MWSREGKGTNIALLLRDNLSESGRDEDGYREDLSSLDVKSETETVRAESPDSSRGDSNSKSGGL